MHRLAADSPSAISMEIDRKSGMLKRARLLAYNICTSTFKGQSFEATMHDRRHAFINVKVPVQSGQLDGHFHDYLRGGTHDYIMLFRFGAPHVLQPLAKYQD